MKPLPIFNKFFYGWYVLAAAFFMLFFNALIFSIMGITMKPISADMSWDFSTMSLVVVIYMIVHALGVALSGKVYDSKGPKFTIIVFSALIFLGTTLASFTTSLWMFILAYSLLVSIGMAGPGCPLVSAIICKWFNKYRGFAVSLAIAGFCVGLFVLTRAAAYLVETYSWRFVFLGAGIAVMVVNTLLALLVIKGDPADFGIKPLGEISVENHDAPITPSSMGQDINIKEILTTRGFWLMLIVMIVCGMGCTFTMNYFIPVATDYGIDYLSASKMYSVTGICGLIGMLAAGFAADKLGSVKPLFVTMFLRIICFVIVLVSATYYGFYIFAVLMGLTLMVTLPLAGTVTANLFGIKNIGAVTGIFATGHHMGGALIAALTGILLKYTGGYIGLFSVSLVLSIIAVIAACLLKEKRYKNDNGVITQD